jgi:hypothetical protein
MLIIWGYFETGHLILGAMRLFVTLMQAICFATCTVSLKTSSRQPVRNGCRDALHLGGHGSPLVMQPFSHIPFGELLYYSLASLVLITIQVR